MRSWRSGRSRSARSTRSAWKAPAATGPAAAFLADYGLTVIEAGRPDRAVRRRNGKSDPLDAESAAQAVQSSRATGTSRSRDAQGEMIRVLRVARLVATASLSAQHGPESAARPEAS